MAEKLSVQIALEGGAEIQRQLADIGTAGQKAFVDIGKAAEKVGGFQNLDPADVTAKLQKLGVTGADAINKIQASVKSAGRLEQVVTGVDAVESGIGKLASAFTSFNGAAASAKGEIREVTGVLRELGGGPLADLTRFFGGVGANFGIFAIGAAAVAGFSVAMFNFAQSASTVEQSLERLQSRTGGSIENLSAMQIAFAAGGTSAQKFGEEFTNLAQLIAEKSASIKADIEASAAAVAAAASSVAAAQLAYARAAAAATGGRGPSREQELAGAAAAARDALDAAERQLAKVAANDLGPLIKQFEDLANGISQSFSPLTTLDSKVQAIIGVLAQMGTSADRLGGSLNDMGEKGQAAFLKLADIFKNLNNEADRWALGRKLGLSPDTIETLSRGSVAIRALLQQMQGLGIALDKLDKTNLSGFREALNSLSAIWTAFIEKLGALASPAFITLFDGLRQGIEGLIADALKLATEFGQLDLTQFGKDLADSMRSIPGIFDGLLQAVKAIGAAFTLMGEAATIAADAINAAFGTKVTGATLVALVLLGRFLGVFGLISGAVSVAVAAIGGIPVAIGLATVALGIFLGLLATKGWDAFSSDGTKALGEVKKSLGDTLTELTEFQAKTAQTEWSAVSEGVSVWDAITSAIQEAIAALLRFLGLQSGGGAGKGAGPGPAQGPGFAGGGLMGGRGTGTSDSNLAWLSRGEHVMPARAVSQPGVLSLLEALRRSGGNLGSVLDRMGSFALGGLVGPMAMPAFAGGGVNSMSHVTIAFPGLPAIGGLRASSAVVEELQRAAAMAQVRSGGRKPSRYS